MAAALEAEDVYKDYPARGGSLSVLRGCSLNLEEGGAAAILGPSGSGKSTLLNILGTLEAPAAGRVRISGEDPFALAERPLADFRNRRIGFIFQDHHLLPQCGAMENVLIPALGRGDSGSAAERGRRLLQRVGLADRMDHLPSELSGGERQRVAVARALINRPTLVLADEPTGNLDRASAQAVADLLLEVQAEERTVLIVVTHSTALARRFATRYELVDGRLVPL
jgi:lipoprotein-releasing system ATP-binding protein